MVTIPPRHYCTVTNPVARDAQNAVLFDVTGQVRLRHADLEIRLAQDPFPLYPGEVLEKVPGSPSPYPLYRSCYLDLGLSTAFWRENKLGPWEVTFARSHWDRIDLLPLHLPSPNIPFLFTCPGQTFESCRPISGPNLPGSRACLKLLASLTLNDLCQE